MKSRQTRESERESARERGYKEGEGDSKWERERMNMEKKTKTRRGGEESKKSKRDSTYAKERPNNRE